jgi:hypothetical protein
LRGGFDHVLYREVTYCPLRPKKFELTKYKSFSTKLSSLKLCSKLLAAAQHLSKQRFGVKMVYNYGYRAFVSVVYVLGRLSDERETTV